ncbi:MAG: DNA repair protein RecN [Candidatus Cloacimonetes bacterium]|jgi:DNA repair protein RecN (Recombination protein N)|nr:DNA repair protein RecN [Candidatus Cloacimonadota bacterium]MBT6993673.1 DNA repair protein RecN [Candidatus Cloacimonadota bacterium]MBT7469906.1 DNA repair protein RecN [Candidatus Cloacimonadota bacterium]
MLKNLRIKNFIIVKDLDLNFENGLQVVTGETGAGKSIIVGAINLIFGADLKVGVHLNKEKPVVLEATFKVTKNAKLLEIIKQNEIEISDNEIFFTKEILANLRSKIFINGRRISIPIAEKFREAMLDFHSQRDQQRLFSEEYQLEIIDIFGDLVNSRKEFEVMFEKVNNKTKLLKKLKKQESENREKIELFKYQGEEINALNLRIGEDDKIQKELNLLLNAEEILEKSREIEYTVLEDENSIYDRIKAFIFIFKKYQNDNSHIEKAVLCLQNSLTNLDDAIAEFQEMQNEIILDAERKNDLESRLNEVNSICLKYNKKISEILEYYCEISDAVDSFSSQKTEILKLQKEVDMDLIILQKMAEKLSKNRKQIAQKLELEIEKNIKKLAIPHAKVKIKFDKVNTEKESVNGLIELDKTGCDRVEIYFSANQGVDAQPFKMVASGGELSRFLLVIKKILAEKTDNRTIIFDEIDQGIGGKTSELLAKFIRDISKFHQVICISHLPQIAAFADEHFAIDKRDEKKISSVVVKNLNSEERRVEIARMLSGSVSKLALMHADELIKKGES